MNPELYAAASNPSSTPDVLRSIAFHNPELRPVVAQNPACYPELRAWIEQQPGYQAPAAQFAGQQPAPQTSQPAAPTTAPALRTPAKKSGIKSPLAITVIAVTSVAAVAVAIAGMTGGLGSVGTALGVGTSQEQGCQNLADALMEIGSQEPDMTDFMADLDSYDPEDWDAFLADSMDSLTNTMTDTLAPVSKKIGNRDVKRAWDDYVDFVENNVSFGSIFGDDLSGASFEEIMAEENRLLARLDELCPYVSVQDINYWGSGASYDGFDTADRTPMAWEVLGYDSIEEYEEAVSNMEGCARGC